jgi:flagellar biosynthetic protein FlhB
MAEESFEERTESPTAKRRQEAREKGTVAKSTEINSVLVLLSGVLMLNALGPWLYRRFHDMLISNLKRISAPGTSEAFLISVTTEALKDALLLSMPVVGVIMAVGMIANYIQVGFLFTLKPLTPSLDKINPLSGFKKLFSMRSLAEMVKNVFKLVIIGWVAYSSIEQVFPTFLNLNDTSIAAIWLIMLSTGYTIVVRICLVLIALAILDYGYQRFEHEKQLKMTRQELKEEHRQMEGDPKVKSRIRSLQMEMSRRRMMQEVPKATVVVTNPTFIAIALRYEPGRQDAPEVVAKGKRVIAEKIKQLARDAAVPIVEDKPLARAMYDKVDIGAPIPMEFFTAVAEIIAYVYRLKNKHAA